MANYLAIAKTPLQNIKSSQKVNSRMLNANKIKTRKNLNTRASKHEKGLKTLIKTHSRPKERQKGIN